MDIGKLLAGLHSTSVFAKEPGVFFFVLVEIVLIGALGHDGTVMPGRARLAVPSWGSPALALDSSAVL